MDLKTIHELARLMKRAELTELEIDDSSQGLKVRLKRGAPAGQAGPLVHVMQGAAPSPLPAGGLVAGSLPGGAYAPAGSGQGAPAGDAMGRGAVPANLPPGVIVFKSPMVGTFYRKPSPDAASFVEPGKRVKEDTTLCIIEAMKVMNEIKAELEGTVLELLVQNAEPVEFGQPLFLIQKG
jgi:acetyl-CoA carboxylase biotin carboxyl carrier protein